MLATWLDVVESGGAGAGIREAVVVLLLCLRMLMISVFGEGSRVACGRFGEDEEGGEKGRASCGSAQARAHQQVFVSWLHILVVVYRS
jgi:hypothetical protein